MKNTIEECATKAVTDESEDCDSDAEIEELEDVASEALFPKKYRIQSEEAVSLKKTYVLHLASRFEGSKAKILVALSNREHALYDYDQGGHLRRCWSAPLSHADSITGVKLSNVEDSSFYTSSLDGTIKLWDYRTGGTQPSLVFKDNTDGEDKLKPISSFDVSCNNKFVCAGTPLVEADSYLLFWDVRKAAVLGGYWEAHTDDITQVKFHPRESSTMMSASTDGLINIYDVSRECEEDAFENALNVETSVQKVEWLELNNEKVIGCITDMETVQFWKTENVSPYAHFSRKLLASTMYVGSWDNAYVSDIHGTANEDEVMLVGGSNVNKGEYLKTMTFSNGKLKPSATFENNKQLVRCSSYDALSETFITAGESGIISVWTLNDEFYDNKMTLKDRVKKNKRN
jgi:WD40 repeat protein